MNAHQRVISGILIVVALTGVGLRGQNPAAGAGAVLVPRQALPLATVLSRWTTAVMQHTPGTSDAALAAVWAMTPNDREVVRDHLSQFLYFLDGGDFSSVRDDVLVVASAALSLFPLTRADFLERAATLHADAVIFDRGVSAPTADQVAAGNGRGGRSDDGGQAVFVRAKDGEYQSTEIENPNWPLARQLLDGLPAGPAAQAFAIAWYHGVTAYLLAQGNYGQAERNLDHATVAMPKGAQTLSDLGCVAEALGMNLTQQVVIDDNDPRFRGRPGLVSAPRALTSASARDAEAKGLFERALAIDPHLPETRVRWARLLELDKRWSDAARQIGLALADTPDPDVAFLAHLVGARAAMAVNAPADAENHLAQALDLFPEAQSAILAASNVALIRGDSILAQARLDVLAAPARNTSPAADPWRVYPLGPGRHPDPPLQALWQAVPLVAR